MYYKKFNKMVATAKNNYKSLIIFKEVEAVTEQS